MSSTVGHTLGTATVSFFSCFGVFSSCRGKQVVDRVADRVGERVYKLRHRKSSMAAPSRGGTAEPVTRPAAPAELGGSLRRVGHSRSDSYSAPVTVKLGKLPPLNTSAYKPQESGGTSQASTQRSGTNRSEYGSTGGLTTASSTVRRTYEGDSGDDTTDGTEGSRASSSRRVTVKNEPEVIGEAASFSRRRRRKRRVVPLDDDGATGDGAAQDDEHYSRGRSRVHKRGSSGEEDERGRRHHRRRRRRRRGHHRVEDGSGSESRNSSTDGSVSRSRQRVSTGESSDDELPPPLKMGGAFTKVKTKAAVDNNRYTDQKHDAWVEAVHVAQPESERVSSFENRLNTAPAPAHHERTPSTQYYYGSTRQGLMDHEVEQMNDIMRHTSTQV